MLDWISENWATILSGLLAFHAAAVAFTRLTPTPKDDAFVAKVYDTVVKFASILSVRESDKRV